MNTTRLMSEIPSVYNSCGIKKGNMKNWKMADDVKEKVIAYAKEDAAKGSYWGQGVTNLQANEVEKVAPNRNGLMAKAMMLQRQHHTTLGEYESRPKGTVNDH